MIHSLFIIIGFVLLIKGADILIIGASSIAKKFHISDFVIGLTIVAFGTSCPELFVNVVASIQGNPSIAIGNILGSTTANILLVLGITAMILPLSVERGVVWKEIPFSFFAAVLFCVFVSGSVLGKRAAPLGRGDGILLLIFFCVFLYYSFRIRKQGSDLPEEIPDKKYTPWHAGVCIVGGLVALTIGGKCVVEGAIHIARVCGVSEAFIGFTIVAVGTCLPELVTSIVAALRKNVAIAVGNVVGSNIFNLLFVLGVSAVIRPIPFMENFFVDAGIMVLANILLFVSMFTGKQRLIDRWEGVAFVCCYVGYIAFLIVRG